MKLTAKRLFAAGAIGLAAIATPISLSVLSGVANAPAASPSTPTSPDTIVYGEGKGSSSNFIQYVPGDGSKPTTESVTAGGGCSSPTIHGVPLLNLSALLYSSDTYVGGTTSQAIVGAFQGRTGVCALTPDWAINNGGSSGAEGLDLGVGSNSLVSSRLFSDATLVLQEQSGSNAQVELAEFMGGPKGTQVATQLCNLGPGATVVGDTSLAGGTCSATTPGTQGAVFDTVEVRDLTPNTDVSVVGPTSTFTLANQICGTQQIQSSGPITATLTDDAPAGTGCKSYSTFGSSITGSTQNVTFNAFSSGAVHFTVTIPWAPETECQPGTPTAANPMPECAPTQVTIDGVNFSDQTYCPAASAAQPTCTTNKTYNYVAVGGTPKTQINETWDSLVDWGVTRH
jgi:hypothetical protein